MYADHVLLVETFKLSEVRSTTVILNSDLQLISEWSVANGLHINPSKSSLLIAGSPILLSRLHSFDVYIQNVILPSSSPVRILGLHVDSSLSFEHHVLFKCRLAYSRLKLLYPLRALSISQKLHVT